VLATPIMSARAPSSRARLCRAPTYCEPSSRAAGRIRATVLVAVIRIVSVHRSDLGSRIIAMSSARGRSEGHASDGTSSAVRTLTY